MITPTFRDDFPVFANQPDLHYLDSAATTQQPQVVIEAQHRALTQGLGPVHRVLYPLGQDMTRAYEAARETVADFVGAKTGEVIFTSNATEALNMAAGMEAPRIQAGDEIVLSVAEHHSNLLPWQRLAAQQRAKLVWIGLTPEGFLDLDDARQKITPRTKVVAITHVSNVLGTIMPVAALASLAHAVGAHVVVDCTQSAGRLPINRDELGADYIALSAHKMYGPTGIGALVGRKEILQQAEPLMMGGGMVTHVTKVSAQWRDIPHRFEAGTPNTVGAVGWAAAIRYITHLGWEKIAEHEAYLTHYLLQQLASLPDVELVGPALAANRVNIVSFRLKTGASALHSHDVAEILASYNVAARAGNHCAQPLLDYLHVPDVVRLSGGIYTTTEDIDAAIGALESAQAALAEPHKNEATVPSL